ncbi:hypothetical protein Aperf_G00000112146 [Anoplocephala perfoliata]
MSHTSGDLGENSSPMQAWNRTPGKPHLSNLSGNLPSATSWGGKKKVNPNPVDPTTGGDIWPLLSDSSLTRKNEPSQWPTPAELAGTARGESLNDFNLPHSWNAPGASLALRSLSGSDDRSDPWPSLDAAQSSHPIDPSISLPRNIASSDNAFSSRQRVHSMTTGGKPRNESFSSWGSPTDGDFSAFANQPLPSTSETKSNQQASGDGVCSSVSDSGNHSDGQCEVTTLISALVNSKECWGQRPVDQSTPWDLSVLNEELSNASTVTATATSSNSGNQGPTGLLGDAVSLAVRQRRALRGSSSGNVPVESNVWASEPSNGTGIWEMHYEGLGSSAPGESRTNRWKVPVSASSLAPSGVSSPPGGHRIVTPAFLNPSPVQQQQTQGRAGSSFQNSFFSSQSQQQRFGQPTASQPPPGSGRGSVLGPNGMLGTASGGAFKNQVPVVAQGSTGWPLSLTPDNQSPLDDAKRFLAPSGPWCSNDRVLGKQTQPQMPTLGSEAIPRWPSPIDNFPTSSSTLGVPQASWLQGGGGMDPRKFVPWSQTTAAAPQRFHLRQNTSNSGVMPVVSTAAAVSGVPPSTQQQQPPLRLLGPPQNHHLQQHSQQSSLSQHMAFLRTEVARQLMLLGFHDEAGVLITDSSGYEDLEKFLYDLRDSTGGMNPSLNQLINNVTTYLMSTTGGGSVNDLQSIGPAAMPQTQPPPPPPLPPPPLQTTTFDLFDNRGGALHVGKQQQQQQQQQPPPSFSNLGRQNPVSSELLNQLFMRESHLQATIFQLDKKKRELGMKHSQLRKMNVGGPTAHHSSSMLQEIVIQQAQISQQIDAQEAQLGQVRLQIACLSRIASGGGNDDSSGAANVVAMLMHLRGGGGGAGGGGGSGCLGGGQPNRMMGNNPMGGFGGTGPRGGGGGLMLNSPSPSAELAPRLADLKLSMDMNRRMPWEGGGSGGGSIWDIPSPHQFGGHGMASSTNAFLSSSNDPNNVFPPLNSSVLADRRWAPSSTSVTNPTNDFHSLPSASSPSTVSSSNAAAAAAASAIWNASWLLLSDISPQFSVEVLRISIANALDQQNQQHRQNGGGSGGGGLLDTPATSSSSSSFEIHPNLPSRYVLVGFLNPADASVVSSFISTNSSTIKLANSVSVVSPAVALAKLQEIKALDDEQSAAQQQQQQTPSQQGNPQATWPPTNTSGTEQ